MCTFILPPYWQIHPDSDSGNILPFKKFFEEKEKSLARPITDSEFEEYLKAKYPDIIVKYDAFSFETTITFNKSGKFEFFKLGSSS